MRLSELQRRVEEFEKARGWESFRESLIYAHLIEELTEIGRYILAKEGYKRADLGHSSPGEDLGSEFAQSLTLFVQLANRFGVDLEKALETELERMEKRFNPDEWRRALSGGK
jgi:NTP pyrophosphatase (non-canonical NTP hydrolase)